MTEPDRSGQARRHRAARLIQEAADRIEAARHLLEMEQEVAEGAGARPLADGALPVGLLSHANEPMAVAHLNAALALRGHICARLLLRLIAEPDRLIPLDELALLLDRGAMSRAAIKVHISTLRAALSEKGLAGSAIETGRRSYAFRAAMLPALSNILEACRFGADSGRNESKRDR
ncbi:MULTISPECIES: helix-turn-helix domain-containing protein [Sphingobium]|uniref:helix-turn-helix domain-containing protein n=1 Tax=Sphingobium TaxID=165695 RepID=UPI0015EC306C|nr:MULTISPECIES: helix-turn-helix domain-containing protein [Sphingobium]MCW2362515.1 DNA-binding response OmpR family regulator [Sphingobium sp. B10D3B]MCW2388714.1 DNA-binding response OmpR family regulator [Sphingobium sp. B11D3B]MCW2400805.1 DNA-binding response OmpR family regulator [Sphingobium sp. B10D7B]MCW2407784.1 DNA-binding response OmpR family regulator [Sphingobium xanthum]